MGFGQNDALKKFSDIDKHLNSAKTGLKDWGFAEQEIRVFRDTNEEAIPDFN